MIPSPLFVLSLYNDDIIYLIFNNWQISLQSWIVQNFVALKWCQQTVTHFNLLRHRWSVWTIINTKHPQSEMDSAIRSNSNRLLISINFESCAYFSIQSKTFATGPFISMFYVLLDWGKWVTLERILRNIEWLVAENQVWWIWNIAIRIL